MEYGTKKGQFLVGVSVLRLGAEIRAIAKKYWKEKPKQWVPLWEDENTLRTFSRAGERQRKQKSA